MQTRRAADTVYFGGARPRCCRPRTSAALIAACRDSFTLAGDAEITLETNPETVTVARMEAYRAAGVKRISMGAQSFRDEELKRLGRVHNAARVREAFAQTRQAGFDNISLDLMMWLPQQTARRLDGVDRRSDGVWPRTRVDLSARALPECALARGHGARGWSQAPEDDAAERCICAGLSGSMRRAIGSTRFRTSRVADESRATT